MRVEVRRRPSPARAVPIPKRSANVTPGLVQAYSDSCFESSTTFYIASPDHPKLGQWAKPSTTKHSQLPQQIDPMVSKCLDEALLFSSSHSKSGSSRPRTAGCSSRAVRRGGSHRTGRARGSSAMTASPSSVTKPSTPAVEPPRAQRPISPTGTTVSSIQGQREAPRIDTPISGRVRQCGPPELLRLPMCGSLALIGFCYWFLRRKSSYPCRYGGRVCAFSVQAARFRLYQHHNNESPCVGTTGKTTCMYVSVASACCSAVFGKLCCIRSKVCISVPQAGLMLSSCPVAAAGYARRWLHSTAVVSRRLPCLHRRPYAVRSIDITTPASGRPAPIPPVLLCQ